jgi:hypothetical protein
VWIGTSGSFIGCGVSAARCSRDGNAKVDDLDFAVSRNHDVAWGEVAMNDSLALAMGIVEALEQLGTNVRRHGWRYGLLALGEHAAQLLEGRPIDVLHGDEVALVDHAELVDGHDVAVGETDESLGLGDEHLDELPLPREFRVDFLDDQKFLEAARTQELGKIDLRHAPSGNLLGQEVLAKGRRHSAHPRASVP